MKHENEKRNIFFFKTVLLRVCVPVQSLSYVLFFPTLWTAAHQAPLSMEFSRQEYLNGLPFPFLGSLPDPWIKPASLVSPALAGEVFIPGKSHVYCLSNTTLFMIFTYSFY